MKEMDGAAAKACDAGELQRAKVQLKAIVASNLESRSGNLEDIGSQAMVYGGVKSGAEIFAAIDSVTAVLKSRMLLRDYSNPHHLSQP